MSKIAPSVKKERRDFLKTVASSGLSAGFVSRSALATGMLLGRNAVAQSDDSIKRVVCMYIPGGTPFKDNKSMFTPSSTLVMPPASAALDPVKSQCVFFENLSVYGGGGHGGTHKSLGSHHAMLSTGGNNVDSYDIALTRKWGLGRPFSNLLLGVQSNVGNHGSASRSKKQQVLYEDNPETVFNNVFNSGVEANPISIDRAKSVLDLQLAEIKQLKSVLGGAEKIRLEEHLASIEKLQTRLDTAARESLPDGCAKPNWNAAKFRFNNNDLNHFDTESTLQIDLAVLALRCNYTKVVSIMLGNHQSGHSVPSLSYKDSYHQSIHGRGDPDIHAITRNYLSGRLAYLLESLQSSTDEMGNPLLDTTIVIQVTDMAEGDAHSTNKAPMLIAGGGSRINRGSVVGSDDSRLHTDMLQTVTEAMGINDLMPKFGNPIEGVIA